MFLNKSQKLKLKNVINETYLLTLAQSLKVISYHFHKSDGK